MTAETITPALTLSMPVDPSSTRSGLFTIDRRLFRPVGVVSFAVWYGFLFLYTLVWLIEGALPPDVPLRSLIYLMSASLTFLSGLLAFSVLNMTSMLRWPGVILIAVVTLMLHSAFGAAAALFAFPTELSAQTAYFRYFSTAMIYDSPIVSSAFMGFAAIHYGHRLNRQQQLSLQTANAARDAQLAALRHQLNPHFLFNTLNSISALVTEGEMEDAEKTILLLSDFLRFSLDSDPVALIPLEDELAIARKYLQIEQVRYEDRLRVTTEIDDAARHWMVPPFLLQPLLENTIKHAVSKLTRQISVSVLCSSEQRALTITVEDDGPGLSPPAPDSTGTGLANLRQRLALIYNTKAAVSVTDRAPHGTKVVITIETSEGVDA
ncbi:MAG: histidine kinase [Pseudomonadota bacterium]